MSQPITSTITPNPLLTSTIQDLTAHSQALWTKFTYNLSQLTHNNTVLSQLLFDICSKQRDNIKQETEYGTKIIQACRELQDSFISLDVLEKKTGLLRVETEGVLRAVEKRREEMVRELA